LLKQSLNYLIQSYQGYGEETSSVIGSSVDVRTAFLFTTKSSGNQNELISGHIVKFLIGFSNRGEKDFTVKHCETSFRYPLDFSYHVQNVCKLNEGLWFNTYCIV
jgi:translocon-associated protein subunit alpha